ncbi:MATE efflux family protein [Athelia psychrophila]|uniref:MATE efflux family protein n=1 Tax=Athelia psychrophila TaxID=1759441 RepID=A0A166C982_9AGAM|nr:MATE efflux family protein [Fibularhizoctonia sp. CBS 109695]
MSTQGHYVGSLPNDYAILAQFAQQEVQHDNDANDTSDAAESTDNLLPATHLTSTSPRRTSFPASYIKPHSQTLTFKPSLHNLGPSSDGMASSVGAATENTPLIPRINEPTPGEDDDDKALAVMFWEELRVLCKYTLPVFGTHVLEYSLVVASVVSIGHLSTAALAAATLGSMTASVSGLSIIQGFCSTLDTMLPSAWTSSRPELVGLWVQRMTVVMAVTLIPIFAIWFNAEPILLMLKQDPEVAALAGSYLRWLSIGLPAYTFNSISRRYFQCQGLFTIPTRIILLVAPLNALLCWLLVWGPPPVRLGFIGAPIATAISFNLISIASVAYGVFFVPHTAWHPLHKGGWRRSVRGLGVLVQLGLSGVGQTASEWWSWELIGLAASLLGPVTLAAQSVLLVSASSTVQAPFALSIAVSVRIGNLLGTSQPRRAGVAANTSILLACVIALFFSALFMVFRRSWAHLFNDDPAVVSLVASVIPLVALFQIFDGVSAVTNGVLRARGKQFVGALLNLIAYYIIGIPFGVWLAFSAATRLELRGLWIGLTVSLVFTATWGVYLCVTADWEKEVRKVMQRIAAENKEHQRERDEERGTN